MREIRTLGSAEGAQGNRRPYSNTSDHDQRNSVITIGRTERSRWPEYAPGLVVASGGAGHAFKFAPVLGRIIANVVERKPDRFDARFAWRARGPLATEDARHR